MEFSLVCNDQEYSNISVAAVLEQFRRLEYEDFIVLVPNEPVANSVFLQIMFEAENQYIVEIRFEYGSVKKFKQYAIGSHEVEECERWLIDYYSGKLPDVTDWEDITKFLQ
ncbi:hypothetical protein ACFSTH_05670 [Paenibacillus yanchengensis]|uniref:Uncharacterized protein n=1 Tax=Paenibacillus yanchengensis TaxID=2035833 RepID=A0ABW4YI66_9BACL